MLEQEHSILVNPVMYPAVPYGTSIIRMTASALHTPAQMRQLVDAIKDVATKVPLHEGNEAAAHKAVAKATNGAAATNGKASVTPQ
jgi:hypothetical protein